MRSGTLAKNAAGEASVTEVVVTSPVARPAASAARPNVGRGSPSASTPTEPLDVREPVDHAVAAAAESVTVSSGSSGGPVTIRPRSSSRSSSRPADESRRAASMCAGPIPSPLMRMTLRACVASPDGRKPGTAQPTAMSTGTNAATNPFRAPRARSTAASLGAVAEDSLRPRGSIERSTGGSLGG